MLQVGDQVLISRAPSTDEDPEDAWLSDFEELIGQHGIVAEDECPYSLDTIYARVIVDEYDEFFLPMPILVSLKNSI